MSTAPRPATDPAHWHAVLAPILRHLSRVTGGPVQFSAQCPAHDDQRASLSISIGDTGKPVLKCHAGCG